MLWISPEPAQDVLYVRFLKGKLIARTVWINEVCTIDLGIDDAPIGVTVHNFYSSRPAWPFTNEILTKYRLGDWADDLITVRDAYFRDDSKLKFQGYRPR